MKFKMHLIYIIIFIISFSLKSENDFDQIKLNIKLNNNNIIKIKSIGKDEILQGTFFGKIQSLEDKNFDNANLECDFMGRSYQGRGFSCGFAVIEDLQGYCYVNNNNEDILITNWTCNTTAGITGDAYCSGKLKIIQGFGKFAGVDGYGKINMPIVKTITSEISSPTNILLSIKYPLSLKK
tara:strand:+ start:694 stop:1236 length:543 start_codon:yes stop_codon:yes gene_type:complete